jgi:hypothetical protein
MTRRTLRGGLFPEDRRRTRPALSTLTRPAPYEHDEQASFFAWLDSTARRQEDPDVREALSWIHSVPNGAHTHKATALKLVREGLKKGVLDVRCDEARKGWHGLAIEMKRKGGIVSPEQLAYMKYLTRAGVLAYVCYSWVEAARVVIYYFDLKLYSPLPNDSNSGPAAPPPPQRP